MAPLSEWIARLDERAFLWINRDLANESLDGPWLLLSRLGEWPVVLVTLAILALGDRTNLRRHALLLLVSLPVMVGVVGQTKRLIDRPRPARHFEPQIEAGVAQPRFLEAETAFSNSMPSGHTAFAFACMIYAGLRRRRTLAAAGTLALLIGLSRVYVGQHFPADVLIGAAVGSAWAAATLAVFGLWLRRWPIERPRTAPATPGSRHSQVPRTEAPAMSPHTLLTPTSTPRTNGTESARARGGPRPSIGLTLVAPVFNELDNLRPLRDEVRAAFAARDDVDWRLVLVDDGSTDGSAERIRELAEEDARVRGVWHPENRGQTSALASGLSVVETPLVATLDSDLQNDPADLNELLASLDGHDAVVGYRVERNDDWLRRVSSRVANGIRNRLTGDSVRDTGCSLKLFRTEALRAIPLFEGMHRFLPTLLRMHGYDVVEHPVSHRPRVHGESKYGVRNRALRAFKDLLAVRWMSARLIQPITADDGLEVVELVPGANRVAPARRGAAVRS